MKHAWLILIVFAHLLAACAPTAQPTAIPTVSFGNNDSNTSENGAPSSDANSVSASAVVVPVQHVELAFATSGRVTAVNVQAGDQVTAGQTLVALDTTIQETRVKQAEANLLAAQIDRKYKERLKLDKIHLEVADAAIAQQQALLDSANAVLDSQFTLTAPYDGTIVSVDVAPSETVMPGVTAIEMGDLSSYVIETTDLSERDVTRVQIGQPVSVFIEALGNEFSGKVKEVALSSSTIGGDVVYKVTIELDDQPEGLLWGMSADVKIDTAD
jgi:RND family efflux transporter MFP subunit